jgi:hypothetical protein
MQLSGESVKLPKAWTQPVSTPKASPDTQFSGPMRVLQELGANEGSDLEINDPIARQIGHHRRSQHGIQNVCYNGSTWLTEQILRELSPQCTFSGSGTGR